MNIAGLQRLSTIDWPGLTACVVFVSGCNLDCYFCHNRSLLDGTAEQIDSGVIETFLTRRRTLLDGLVISGGEPLLQPDLMAFAERWKAVGYQIKIDTNGTSPSVLLALLEQKLVDYIALDYKGPWDRYPELCAASTGQTAAVMESAAILLQSQVAWELRTTVLPDLTLSDLRRMAAEISRVPVWYLQEYHEPAQFRESDRARVHRPAYSRSELKQIAAALHDLQPGCQAR